MKPAGNSSWIKSPAVDLFYFSYGWLVILAAFIALNYLPIKDGRWWIISFVLLVSCLHRHITFPLVYGDAAKFRMRPRSYTVLPFVFLGITLASVLYLSPASYLTQALPQPLHFSPRDQVNFRISQDKTSLGQNVRMKGTEKTVTEVAATLQDGTKGKVLVTPEGDRLRFTLAERHSGDWFRVTAGRGPRDLNARLGFDGQGSGRVAVTRPLFAILAVTAGLWCLYHALMQKAGILRIYSRKGGAGKPWLDKAMVFSWAALVLLFLGALPHVQRQIARAAPVGQFFVKVFAQASQICFYLGIIMGVVCLVVTVLYLREELARGRSFQWPKNLFMVSIVALLSVFFYDAIVGYVVFGFSHAIEYLAFVNIFSKKSYSLKPAESSSMARWVRRQGWAFGAFLSISLLVFVPWYFYSRPSLEWYIVGSSFLHFIYDGWIWKVRDPQVGQPLGIHYPSALPAQS